MSFDLARRAGTLAWLWSGLRNAQRHVLARRGWRVTGLEFPRAPPPFAAARSRTLSGCGLALAARGRAGMGPARRVDLALIAYLHLPRPELVRCAAAAGERCAGGGCATSACARNLAALRRNSDPNVLPKSPTVADAATELRVRNWPPAAATYAGTRSTSLL